MAIYFICIIDSTIAFVSKLLAGRIDNWHESCNACRFRDFTPKNDLHFSDAATIIGINEFLGYRRCNRPQPKNSYLLA